MTGRVHTQRYLLFMAGLLLALCLAGCGAPGGGDGPAGYPAGDQAVATTPPRRPTPTNAPPDLATETSAQPATATPAPTGNLREVTVLYTNDEHGWMEGMEPGRGAANLLGLWQANGYNPATTLIISGGDMWTGPAISTWFEGESMVEVMNAMGYAAAAVGNHEFDFGLAALQARAAQANFPLLSANIRDVSSGAIPAGLGIQPYTLVTVNGVQVGLIGLTTTSTPRTTNPSNVAGFEFIDYETALRETVPEVRAAGAQLILVPAHICQAEAERLARQVSDLGLAMVGGGHCNELFAKEIEGTVVLEGGYHLTSYAAVTFQYDLAADAVVDVAYDVTANQPTGVPDPAVTAIVQRWRARVEGELNEVIGYSETGLARRGPEMQALVTEAWLASYPADVAITNLGGFRADLPAGAITLDAIVTVLPFNNTIVEVEVTGAQLLDVLSFAEAAVGGASRQRGEWVLHDGTAIDPAGSYTLLVNDFMYAGGDGYEMLAEYDPAAYNTAIDWRQPLIDWIKAQNSSADNPIDAAIAALVR